MVVPTHRRAAIRADRLIQRRRFLALLAGVTGLTKLQSCGAIARFTPRSEPPIVVIGAGLAGLAAAQQVQAQGQEVLVLEGRDRIGGRVWTSQRWADLPVDLGASWIHGIKGNPLTELAATIGTELRITRYNNSVTYNTDGTPLSETEEEQLEYWQDQLFEELQAAQDRDPDISVQQVLDALIADIEADPETIRYLHFILSGAIEQEYAGSGKQLSAHWFDSGKAFKREDALLADGFRVIAEHLAQDLEIQLGQVVQAIDWSQSPVRIVTDKSEFLAEQVLVTVPLGVLQSGSVRFSPELPAQKKAAIAQLGMGVLNKCYLRFASAFWPTDVDWLEYIPARHGEWTEWVSLMRTYDLPVLLGFNAAERGKAIEAWSDQQIVASAMTTLRTIYGSAIPEPLDYQITRWAADPLARGAYSFNAVGTHPKMRRHLASPLSQRLFFAGEATEPDHFGTTHGAYLSGLRAAKQMLSRSR